MMKEMDKEGVEKYEIIAVLIVAIRRLLTDEQKKEITKTINALQNEKSN